MSIALHSVLPWLGVYALLLAAWALIITRRSHPTLWKGSALVVINSLFVLATIVAGLMRANSGSANAVFLPRSIIVFDILLVLIAFWLRNKWLLIGVTYAGASQILERCFHQTRSASTRRSDDYVVKCGELEMIAGISKNRVAIGNFHVPLPGHTIRFSGARASKKAQLIRSLFSKQFGGSFPTPRIKA